MSEGDNKTLSEAGIEALEGQEAQVKRSSKGAGPPVASQDAESAEDELSDIGSVAEGDEPAEAEDDDSGYALVGDDDKSEPSQWESDILCVADPFIRSKVKGFLFFGEMVECFSH